MEKKLLFVVNPKAGRTVIKSDLINIIDIFSDAGYIVTVYPTKNEKKTEQYIYNNARDYDLVVSAGGDGTLDNTVSGIMKLEREIGRRIHMGYIPCGSTNDYAKSLDISMNPVQAAKDIIEGDICHVDVGRLEDTYFIYVAAFGAFTEVTYSTPQDMKNTLGRAAYMLEAGKALFNLKNYHMKISFDEEVVEGDFVYGQITNSLSVGGFKNLTDKNMFFSDGLFETVLIRTPETPIELQRIINSLLAGDLSDQMIISKKSSKIVVKCREEVPWTVDGEYGGSYKVTRVSNIRRAAAIVLKDKSSFRG
ncbi:MAG: YegS/Rv2252/BmrU family lipid kinase [Eubacterium sp.]|nr:YegS/Rv2252/BmrU family lipid kinase [Eubacterium sp.]